MKADFVMKVVEGLAGLNQKDVVSLNKLVKLLSIIWCDKVMWDSISIRFGDNCFFVCRHGSFIV